MTSEDGHCYAACGANPDEPLILRSLAPICRRLLNKPHVRVDDLLERRIKPQTFQVAGHAHSRREPSLVRISAVAGGVVTCQRAQNGISLAFRTCGTVDAVPRSRAFSE